MHVTPLQQLVFTRVEKSPSPATVSCPRHTTKERPLRDFITGIEYRTKFMREIRYEKYRDRTSKSQIIHRPWSSYTGVNSREKQTSSYAAEYVRRRRAAGTRSVTAYDQRPRDFLTGVEYRTKFMRPQPYDIELKSGTSSGDINSKTTPNPKKVNKWKHDKSKTSLLRIPLRKAEVKRTTEVSQNIPYAFPKTSQYRKHSKEIKTTQSTGHSGAKTTGFKRENQAFGTQGNPKGITAGDTRLRQSPTKFNYAMKAEHHFIQRDKTTTHIRMNEASRLGLALGQRSCSADPQLPDHFMQGINRADLSINLPSSPISEPVDSNSLHTTPRSPRVGVGKKNLSNSLLQLTISETISVQSQHSLSLSETLEIQRTSSPTAKIGSSSKSHSPSKKYKFLHSSDNTLTYKSRETFANALRNKMTNIKQEPVTFTTQFLPLLRWTNKTNAGDIFEPRSYEGSNSRPNSTNSNVNSEGGNTSIDNTSEGELSSQLFKETASSDGIAVQNECYTKEQQEAAEEDYNVQNPNPMCTSGEGENLTNFRRAKKKFTTQDGTFSKDADRSHARNPVKQAWKLTGSQQIVSGSALWPVYTSPLLKRPQPVKNIAVDKQSAAYKRIGNAGDIFEPRCYEGLNNRPNSTNSNENSEGGNTSIDKTSEGELANQPFKETASSDGNGNAVQNECHIKLQQGTADEEYDVLNPSLLCTSGEGENLTNVRAAKKKSTKQDGTFSKDADRSHTRNPVKQVWKISGSALWPVYTSPLLQRPQSVKNISVARQSAAYKRSGNWSVGDFARRPVSAAKKKPVWK